MTGCGYTGPMLVALFSLAKEIFIWENRPAISSALLSLVLQPIAGDFFVTRSSVHVIYI